MQSSMDMYDAELSQPITLAEGWRAFCEKKPYRLTDDATAGERRRWYGTNWPLLGFEQVQDICDDVEDLVEADAGSPGAARGIAISGEYRTGKSSAARFIGRHIHRQLARPDGNNLPVLYLQAPSAGRGRQFVNEFTRFAGYDFGTQETTRVVHHLRTQVPKWGTRLIIIDEANNLDSAHSTSTTPAQFLKDLMDQLPSIFLLVGHDISNTRPFTSNGADSVRGRFNVRVFERFRRTKHKDDDWRATLGDIDRLIELANHQQGDLVEHEALIFERTEGLPGDVYFLIQKAARDAIRDGTERITAKGLHRVDLSQAARDREAKAHRQLGRTHANAA